MLYCQKMKKYFRTALALVIIAATITAFTYYAVKHPETVEQLKQLPPYVILLLLSLYGISFLAYVMVTRSSLQIYNVKMSRQENILFNAYSSLINFFGPGQSGPVFRSAYLKKKHGLSIKNFAVTMVLYFGFFAVLSAMLMFIGSRPWWQTTLLVLITATASFLFFRWYKKRKHVRFGEGFNLINVGGILVATMIQVCVMAIVYGVELQRVGAGASIGEILSYTGVANFSLFVALTPGAIGIREAFLVFSQGLHNIDSTTIVTANILDRAVYLLFLGLLFLMALAMHAKDKLQVNQLKIENPKKDLP